ncbi:hypothetical protein SPRG_06293 [Saprolegnia parasitica CBS 223.65]|uniref:Major facilitator superfamily (MFS) profile domain-containing protein n=1 Tax=Saprolegnia parasitica (strain CBS 223.65) TaxID=695850 RepID=A0A067CCQ2_SAPPC|nr:hypothetical protein SPRG_06293 [Saprolegnia parasitica CBS 223.65]KDO28243.1 hypothetical protein SPRG_06293 [Saprolegnia parasitica CBS 223.65]|eukprot:XP_012201066.1 hypothetical protein SPRG_06293 [Saprolegnia parasitica CBS 223.65]
MEPADVTDQGDDAARRRCVSPFGACGRWLRSLVELYGLRTLAVLCGTNLLSGLISIDLFAMSTTTLMLPWALKPIWGLITDTVSIGGFHRKPFYVLCGCLAFCCTSLLGLPNIVSSYELALGVLLLRSVGYAFIDVIIDAVLAEQARKDVASGAQNLQSIASFHKALGVVLASILKGPLITALGPRRVFTVMSFVMPLPYVVLSCVMVEARNPCTDSIRVRMRRQSRLLATSFASPLVWRPALFLLLSISLSPTIVQLGFSPNFIASLSLIGALTAMATTLLYQAKMKHVAFRSVFVGSQIGVVCANAATLLLVTRTNVSLGIPDKAFVIGEDIAIVIVKYMQIMPITVLCAKLCPRGVEGTMFAGFDSIMNGSYLISGYLGALIAQHAGITERNFEHLWIVQLIIVGSRLLPFVFVFWLISDDINVLTTNAAPNETDGNGKEDAHALRKDLVLLPPLDAVASVTELQIRHV